MSLQFEGFCNTLLHFETGKGTGQTDVGTMGVGSDGWGRDRGQ